MVLQIEPERSDSLDVHVCAWRLRFLKSNSCSATAASLFALLQIHTSSRASIRHDPCRLPMLCLA